MTSKRIRTSTFQCELEPLRHSAVVDVSDGSVSWTTEYAQAMYERDHVGSTKNAKATGHWFETAKENHLDQWTQDVKDALFSR